MPNPRAWLCWSSGKDSAWALHVARRRGDVDVVGLLSTVTEPYDRVSMHGVRSDVLEAQAVAAGLPLLQVPIPQRCSNQTYEAAMREAVEHARADGVTEMLFGDLFLEDVRQYRERHYRRKRKKGAINPDSWYMLANLPDCAGNGGKSARARRLLPREKKAAINRRSVQSGLDIGARLGASWLPCVR